MVNRSKVAIIGCGFVGSSAAFALMQSGLFNEMVLIDYNQEKAVGEAMDIGHGLPYARPMVIRAGTYAEACDAGIIIITAGAAQKVGETRLDLIEKNAAIMRSVIQEIKKGGEIEGILLIVSNPVDILTHVAYVESGLPANRVIGSGTVLDTARLKYLLSQHLGVDARNVHGVIIGEHGDSELAVWSITNISGIPLNDFCEHLGFYEHKADMKRIYESVRDSAYEIIKRKGATYYGVAMAITRICECIMKNENAMLPVSTELFGTYGLSGLALSIPSLVGSEGVKDVLELPLNEEEKEALYASARALQEVIDRICK